MREFSNQKVAVIGLQVEGQDSARFFTSEGADVTCCDRQTKEELGAVHESLANLGVKFQLGKEGYLHGLNDFDIVMRSPGISLELPEFKKRLEKGLPISSNTKLFLELCEAPIVGVTGTKGKGTTSTLIYEMIKKEGLEAHLGGNVGVPLLSRVREIAKEEKVVLEMSSFQLEDCERSPHVSVVLRITQDHLQNTDALASNFHADKEAYVQAKTAIVRYQKEGDVVICNAEDEVSMSFAKLTPATLLTFSRGNAAADAWVEDGRVYVTWQGKKEMICAADEIQLRGIHNLENIAAATLAALSMGVSLDAVRAGAREFKGLPHRLELVRTVHGVSYYDDSFSTVPETAIAAVEAFSEPAVLILGGSEKGSDFSELGKVVSDSKVHTVIAIGKMTQRIVDALTHAGYRGNLITGKKNMTEIVTAAAEHAKQGDVVLLSPACASFDMFKNYKDRGAQFNHEVSLL